MAKKNKEVMKVSSLIETLKKVQEEHGDLDVVYYDNPTEEAGFVREVEFVAKDNFPYVASGFGNMFNRYDLIVLKGF